GLQFMVNTRASTSKSNQRSSFYGGPKAPSIWERAWTAYGESDFILRKDQLDNLATHKYSAVDTSWLDDLCMKKFWDQFVLLYPTWLAPNLITLVGLLVNALCVFVFSWYCPTASEAAPNWVYLLAAIGVFTYQTLDATDGKQARRINVASPLGELFDHGCDSMSQILVTLHICYTLRLGELGSIGVFPVCVLSIAIFYCAHWSTYCTGRLQFAKFDVTEAQMVVIGMLLITSLLGPGLWTIGVGSLDLRLILLLLCFVALIRQFFSYLDVIMNGGCGRNGATVADTSVIFPICPLLAVIIPFCMIHSKASYAVYHENITIFALFFGAVAAKATNRVIVAYMSRSELYIWDSIYFGPLFVILNQYWNLVVPEVPLLYVMSIYAYINLLVYCYHICNQLCHRLSIYTFSVAKRRD
ncbi:hypothetical protein PMAYCL1PPCAC_29459, partial [Pristionchus mayeri]